MADLALQPHNLCHSVRVAALAMTANGATSTFITSTDGLRLHARCYGRARSGALPIVCLPGLARTAADFDALATALAHASDHPRRVIALDYRGRGQSDYDRDPGNYTLPVELADVLTVVTALEAMPAIYVGTSRGGILAMLLAAARPTAMSGVVLNDIGPVIEAKGLMRIKGYVGKLPQPATYEEGAEVLRRLFDAQFPKLTAEDWLSSAKRAFKREKDRLVPTYDVALAKTLASIDPERPVPSLWNEFDALARLPAMVIHGSNSDILAPSTIEAMRGRHPSLEVVEVSDQGHAPLLADQETIARIGDFAGRCDRPRG
ncbi:MAG TPA: alpha/beta hydrolase [Pseudolabrys sp.]|nr:alpha/beta hydrolase [Pseudolabrys sp.]